MLCLLGDGYYSNHSAVASAAQDATRGFIELAEEPLTTTPKTAAAHLRQTSDAGLFNESNSTNHCSQQQYSLLPMSATTQLQQQQQMGLGLGFCGSTSSAAGDDGLTGVELGFNTMDYNFSDIEPLWIRKEWPDILVRVSFVAPVVLLGIVGNLTIIWSICKFKSFRSKPTNIFILSMAIADLITALVCPLAALFTDIYQFYVLGSVLCRLEGSIKITCLLVSAYSLNWLSFIWLRYIVQPCRTRTSIKQSWIILACIWMASVLTAAPLFCWRLLRSRHWRDLNEVWCCELIHISKYYWVVITFIIVYLPTFFMTIILVIILIQMDKFEAKLRRSRSNQSSSSLTINMKYRRRIVKVLILYLGISIVCWAPFQFSIIYRHFRTEACLPAGYSDFVFASQLLASVPGALNPFVFGFLSQPFRQIVTTFWMFKFLDKLLIWRRRPNSDNHQMNQMMIKTVHHQPHIVAASNHQQQTTTRIRSSSTSKKRSSTTIAQRAATNTQPARSGARNQHQHHHHSHHHHNQPQLQHSSKQGESVQQVQQHGSNQRTTSRHHHHHQAQSNGIIEANVVVRGCENAAYESTVGDELPASQVAAEKGSMEQQAEVIGTTSFIRQHQHHRAAGQQLEYERPLSPTSVVSMDSINIEENLGNTTIDDHLYLHQHQQRQGNR